MAPEASTPVRSTSELENRLRRRLRLISMLLGSATGSLAFIGIAAHWAALRSNPSTLWTEPPLPGVLLVIATLAFASVGYLAKGRRPGLPRLRIIEGMGVGVTSVFFAVNQTRALETMLPGLLGKPMELGIAQGAPWSILIVAYGVLIPSSGRHAAIRTAAIALFAFLPEFLLLPNADTPMVIVVAYVALKAFIIALMSALALYGSYRIETLGHEAEVARELGQYLLTRSLGEGGMGSVYLAEHRFLRRPCAVKLIRAEQAGDEVSVARFEREVQSAAGLTHPNTVQIYDYGRSVEGTFYFAMEFLPGVSLDELVARHGPLPPARAVHILTQLCGALHEAHERGLVHRDLKPGNVMLCERGGVPDVAKLLDFGLVAAVEKDETDPRITQTGMVVGTPGFMSPEQCMGDAAVTPASDIYSLGALAHFLLTGSSPFGGRNPMHILMAHVNEPPRPVSEIRPEIGSELSAVLLRCLAKKPEDRFPDVLALQQALVASLGAERWTTQDAREWGRSHSATA